MKILELNKTPYENGYLSGKYFYQLRDEVIKEIKTLKMDKEYIIQYKCLYERLKNEYPRYYEELNGKADALEIEPFKFFTLHCPELNNIQKEQCSTIICKKENGHFILSHNEDDTYIENNFCMSKVIIDQNNYFYTNDMVNMPFGNGISWNSYGLIKTINYLHDEEHNLNHLPRYFAQRHISEAKSIDDLIQRCHEIDTASGYHVNAIDLNQMKAVSIEVSVNEVNVVYIDDMHCHTNHYIHTSKNFKSLGDIQGNSILRLENIQKQLKNSDKTIEGIRKILNYRSDDDSYMNSIFQKKGDWQMTIFNFTVDTETNEIILEIFINNEIVFFEIVKSIHYTR